jgi:1-deoxyxylulose-5-phosphate synthase
MTVVVVGDGAVGLSGILASQLGAHLVVAMSRHSQRFFGEGDRVIVDAVQKIAEARGIPMAQVALAWVLKNRIVTAPIVGATKPHHLADAAASIDIHPQRHEVRALEEPYTPREPAGF